jgi:hypothetical protein
VRIFSTTPAPTVTATAGSGPSLSKGSGDLFGQHLAGASQAASAQAAPDAAAPDARTHPSSDAQSSQESEAQTSAETSSKDTPPSNPESASVDGSSAPVAASSPHALLPPAVLALLQPATDFDIPASVALKLGSDPRGASSQADKPVKSGERGSAQKTPAADQSATAAYQQPAATGPVPALLCFVADGSLQADGAQKGVAVPETLKAAADADANASKQAPQHATVEGSPAAGSVADAAGQQLADAGALQLSQQSIALPVIGSSTTTSALPAPAAGGVSEAQAGKDSQKGATDLQAGNRPGSASEPATSGLTTSGPKSGGSTSTGTPAAGSAAPAAPIGATSAQQANVSHAGGPQVGSVVASGTQAAVPHVLAQDGGAPRSSLAGAAPHATDVHGDALEHPGELAEPGTVAGIDSARLIQTMSQTEMQVGMHSAEFGDISIRASLAQQQMMAQISVSHDELSQAMMAHLSTVQTKIGNDYGLQASISVQHQGTATPGQGGGQSYQQQQRHTRSNHAVQSAQASIPEIRAHPGPGPTAGSGYRLDIQA